MRILFIAPFGSCHKQTVPRRMVPLAAALARRGHEMMVLIPAWDCPQQAGQSWEQMGVSCVAPARGPAPHPLVDPWLYGRCWRQAKAFAPDIVHVFKGLGYSGLLGYRFHRLGTPVFVDIDDLETAQGWGRQRPWPVRWWGRRQEKAMMVHTDAVTVASVVLKRRVAHWRKSTANVVYLPNGVTRAATPAPVADNDPVVLLYTRGNDMDPDRLRLIWHRIRAAVPAARLRVVGDWVDVPALPAMERMGWVEDAALPQALRSSAVALFPVMDTPLVRAKCPARLLDCLGHGLPVVSEDVGEYALLAGVEQVEAAEDTYSLADTVISLLQDPEKRRLRSAISWRQAARYDWDDLAGDLAEQYERITG